jgi:pimeloyl-ACP methyl ester carboxylesterase
MAARPDMAGFLPTIRVPTLCVVGVEDALSPPAEMRAVAAAIPNAEFVEIPAAGHMAPMENPSAVNDALVRFIEALP